MTLRVEAHCGEDCFDLPEWRRLLDRDPDRHIFATPEWNRLWWEEFGRGKELFLLTMDRGDDIAAIVPLYRKDEGEQKVLRFMGGIDLTDYLGPICSIDDRDDVAASLVEWLADGPVEWDEFDAHNMPVPFGFADYLVDHADRRGLSFQLDQEETTALMVLPDTWDGYLDQLISKERRELKRKIRRLQRDAPEPEFRSADQETFERDFKLFVEMHRGAEGHKGHFMKPEIATFFERIARAFLPLGWLRLDLLEIAGRPAASTFGFELDQRFYLYNSAYDPDLARFSPGVVLVATLVERSIDRGMKVFDFLRGPERYKYQLGAEPVPLHNVRITKPSQT